MVGTRKEGNCYCCLNSSDIKLRGIVACDFLVPIHSSAKPGLIAILRSCSIFGAIEETNSASTMLSCVKYFDWLTKPCFAGNFFCCQNSGFFVFTSLDDTVRIFPKYGLRTQ